MGNKNARKGGEAVLAPWPIETISHTVNQARDHLVDRAGHVLESLGAQFRVLQFRSGGVPFDAKRNVDINTALFLACLIVLEHIREQWAFDAYHGEAAATRVGNEVSSNFHIRPPKDPRPFGPEPKHFARGPLLSPNRGPHSGVQAAVM